jgi:hypothetical protein
MRSVTDRRLSIPIPIDVGDRITRSVVIRDGVQVKAPVLETEKVLEFVDKLPPANRFTIPRVLTQGIAPGVKVARGTVVDVTCVPGTVIKVGLLETSHVDLRERTMANVANVINDELANILSIHETASALSTADRAKVSAAFTQLQITTDEGQAERSFETAFQTLRDVQVFR